MSQFPIPVAPPYIRESGKQDQAYQAFCQRLKCSRICLSFLSQGFFNRSLLTGSWTAIMRTTSVLTTALAVSSSLVHVGALSKKHWHKRADHLYLPKQVNDYQTAVAPNNVTVRYKNPNICETTPGVDSYSGYVDLSPDVRPQVHWKRRR